MQFAYAGARKYKEIQISSQCWLFWRHAEMTIGIVGTAGAGPTASFDNKSCPFNMTLLPDRRGMGCASGSESVLRASPAATTAACAHKRATCACRRCQTSRHTPCDNSEQRQARMGQDHLFTSTAQCSAARPQTA